LQVVDGIELLRPKIKESILADMDRNREAVTDDLELVLLVRELPDRLLLFKNIVKDPQVRVAAALVKGDDAGVIKGITGPTRTTTGSGAGTTTSAADKSKEASKSNSDKIASLVNSGTGTLYDKLLHPRTKAEGAPVINSY
jgi:hypothetical protein